MIAFSTPMIWIEALIPTGEYPTMLASSDDGRTLYVSEGKGGTGPSMG